MKEWVIISISLLIIIILIDGIRRKRNERYGKIKVSRNLKKRPKTPEVEEEDVTSEKPNYTSELPNGGARVIGARDNQGPLPSIEKKAKAKSFLEKQSRQELLQTENSRRARRSPEQANLNLGESVPILMESVADTKGHSDEDDVPSNVKNHSAEERIEPSFSALSPSELDDYEDEAAAQEDDHDPLYRSDAAKDSRQDDEADDSYEEDEDYSTEQDSDEEAYEEEAYEEELSEQELLDADEDYEDEDDVEPLVAADAPNTEPEEVLVINVMAFKGEMFNGADLLDIVLKCGMRYGDMDIFHRYTDAKGDGALLFSMANMVKPGTFDLDAMDEFETPGVSLFMTLPLKADSMQSFDLMLDTARAIAETLDGELKDEQRSVMTRQTIEHCRQRVRDFERMRLFRRPPR